MTRHVSQALLLQTGLYPPEVVAKYARAKRYQPRLTIETFVKMYEAANPDGGISLSADYCPRVSGVSEKLEVHKRIMQNISIDTLAAALNAKTRKQCSEFMRNPDAIHVLLSTKIKDHPLCPNTMAFYAQVLGKSNPVQFHGQLVNGIVAAVQDGWDTFAGHSQEWNFLGADKFKKFFSKRVQQFTNLEGSIEVVRENQAPELEPISEPSTRAVPGSTPLEDEIDDDTHFEESESSGISEECSVGSEEEYSSDGVVEVASVLADNKPQERKLRPYTPPSSVESHSSTPVLQHVAKDKRYRADLVPISVLKEMQTEQRRTPLIPLNEVSVRSKLTPIRNETQTKTRPKLSPISEEEPRTRPQLQPISTDRTTPAPVRTRQVTTKPDRLGGEVLPPTTARRSNLTAIGAEVSQNRKSNLQPVGQRTRPKLAPIKKEQQPSVRARPKLIPDEPAAKTTQRPRPGLLDIDDEEEDMEFANVKLSLRWLESYLDTNGPQLTDQLVFFAPTNGIAQAILNKADRRGKNASVKKIVEFHLCEHSGKIDKCELDTVSGHTIKMGLRGKILEPEVKAKWADFVGTKNFPGFKVDVYVHGNAFSH